MLRQIIARARRRLSGSEVLASGISGLRPVETRRRERERACLALLREIDRLVLSSSQPQEILATACDGIVKLGYPMAWIGLAEPDHSVRPVAAHGFEADDLNRIGVRWDDSPEGRGSTGTAIRTGKSDVARETPSDIHLPAWREAARRHGFRSSAAIPLTVGSETIGALTVMSDRPDAFDAGEVEMLEDVGRQLALSISFVEKQRAVALSEERFRGLYESARDGILLFSAEGRAVDVNPAACSMFGYGRDELVGSEMDVLRFPGEELPVPALDAPTEDAGASVAEARMRRKDGSEIWVELAVAPFRMGEAMLPLWFARDVTRRRRAEDALRRRETEYRELFEKAAFGLYRSTVGGRLLAANPALVEMLGYDSAEELQAMDMATALYQDPAQRAQLIERYRQAGRIENVEVGWKRKDGTPITVRLNGVSLRNREGEVEGFQMVVEDVTERQDLENRLRQAQKMEEVGQLSAGIAHDFKNILTAILGNSELVLSALGPDAELRADVAAIRDAATKAAGLIKKLLAFSRQEKLDLVVLNLAHLVREFSAMLRRMVPEHIDIKLFLDEPDATVRADRGALEQVLLNLATNARDAMPAGGTLLLQIRRSRMDEEFCRRQGWGTPGEYACLSVSDTGFGMDERTRRRVFEPFFTTKAAGTGTGLGMAMVYGLVKQHQGFVNVYSELEQGTTVKVYLPLVPAPPELGAPQEIVEVRGGTETILLAEDEEVIRRASRRILEKFGYTVLVAADGEEALALYRAHRGRIALVILDVVMPKLGGRQVYERLRRYGRAPRALFMSGYSSQDIRETAVLEPEMDFLSKPWTMTDLLTRVRAALDRA